MYLAMGLGASTMAKIVFGIFSLLVAGQSWAEEMYEPDLPRSKYSAPEISSQDIELALFVGQLSIEAVRNILVTGVKAAYHLTPRYFVELSYDKAFVEDTAYRETDSGVVATNYTDYQHYDISLGMNLVHGEFYINSDRSLPVDMYAQVGTGSTSLDEDYTTYNLTLGGRVLLDDETALRVNFTQLFLDTGAGEIDNHFQASIGVSVYF